MKSLLRLPQGDAAFNSMLFLAGVLAAAYYAVVHDGATPFLMMVLVGSLVCTLGYWQQIGATRYIAMTIGAVSGMLLARDLPDHGVFHWETLLVIGSFLCVYWFWREAITPEEIAREQESGSGDEGP